MSTLAASRGPYACVMAIPPGDDAETLARVDGAAPRDADAELVRAAVRDQKAVAAQQAADAEATAAAEERLVRLETQTEALTEAVIDVRNTAAEVAAAVQAVEQKIADDVKRRR